MRKTIVFLALFVSAQYARGQWSEPVNLGPNINSSSFEFGQCLNPTEDTIIFASDRPGGKGGYDLWYSWKEKGEWLPAENMGDSINTQWNENSPFLSSNGRFLYFSSTRPNGPGDYDIYVSERADRVWRAPVLLPFPVNTSHSEGWPCLRPDGNTLYFATDRHGGLGHLDLWSTERKDGRWGRPENLGDSVNGPGWEGSPSFSADETVLYFRRDTVSETKPSAIWRSVKRFGIWQGPVKLGPQVNGEDVQAASPWLSPDGKRLYFNADRKPNSGLTDIFMSSERGNKP